MTVSLKHTKVSAIADNPAAVSAGEVVPSDWNAEHVLTMATARLLGRTTAGTGAAEEISVGTGLTLSGGVLTGTASTPPGGDVTTVQFHDTGGVFGGDPELSYDKANNRLYAGVNASTETYSWFSGHDGLTILTGTAAGGWARGVVKRHQGTHAIQAGAGFVGANEIPTSYRVGFGVNWYDPTSAIEGLLVTSDGHATLSTGAVPSAWHSSFRAFEIGQKGTGIWNGRDSSNFWITANAYYNASSQWIYANTGAAWAMNLGPNNDVFNIRRASSGTGGTALSWATFLNIDANGNLSGLSGNSSSTAAAAFSKSGSHGYGKVMLVSCTGGTDGPQIWYRRDAVSEWGVGMIEGTNSFGWNYGGNHSSYGTLKMLLDEDGHLQIRRNSPTGYANSQLELYSSAGDVACSFHAGGSTAGSLVLSRSTGTFHLYSTAWTGYANLTIGSLLISGPGAYNSYGSITLRGEKNGYVGVGFNRSDGTYIGTMMMGTDRAYWGLYDETLGAWPFYTPSWTSTSRYWYLVGTVTASQNIIAYYSDERLKKKLGNIQNALDKIVSLNGFYYVQNELGNKLMGHNEKVQVALSAQEVQKVAPEVVCLAPFDMKPVDGQDEPTSKSGEDYLTIQYERLVPLLVEAIKELSARVKYLEAFHE